MNFKILQWKICEDLLFTLPFIHFLLLHSLHEETVSMVCRVIVTIGTFGYINSMLVSSGTEFKPLIS